MTFCSILQFVQRLRRLTLKIGTVPKNISNTPIPPCGMELAFQYRKATYWGFFRALLNANLLRLGHWDIVTLD